MNKKDYINEKKEDYFKSQFKKYVRSNVAEMRPYEGEDITGISISEHDIENGSPKKGDMIARNPKNYEDQWLVAESYFRDNFILKS